MSVIMAPALPFRVVVQEPHAVVSDTAEVAWMNQGTWRHCHFGPKSAPQHRDFGPEKVWVSNQCR
jgi:hypothetical protein